MSDAQDEYSESLETEFRKLEDALLSHTVKLLAPSEPIRLSPDATVEDGLARIVDNRRAAVVIVDGDGRLIGIFTERDFLTRVARPGLDPRRTKLGDVMTRDPETLDPDDRICYAVNRMHTAGHRTVPLVDAERRPIGIVTANDVVSWLAEIFPEAVLNSVVAISDVIRKRPNEFELGEPVVPVGYHAWAVKRGNKELRDLLNQFFMEQRKNGNLYRLQEKWLGRSFPDLPWEAKLPGNRPMPE